MKDPDYERDIDICVGPGPVDQSKITPIRGSIPYQGWAGRLKEGTTVDDLLKVYPIILEAPDFTDLTEDGLIRITHPVSINYLNHRPTEKVALIQGESLQKGHRHLHVQVVKRGDDWFGKVSK